MITATPVRASGTLAIVAPSAYFTGGVQTWLDYLVPGLAPAGWQVAVLLVHGEQSDANRYLAHHPFPRVRLVTNSTGSREGRVRALADALRRVRPDVVLTVNIVDTYEAVNRLRMAGEEVRVAMALHGLHASFLADMALLRPTIDAVIATNRLGCAAATRIAGMPTKRVHYAPCGVTVPALPDLGLQGPELVLLFAGRFDQQEKRVMDLPTILSALERMRMSYRLRLAGAGPDEAELRKRLAQFGSKVEFVGLLDEAALHSSFYQPGAVVLIMSPSETGPLVAWEAMARGVAVATSSFIGIGQEDALRDGDNCLVFPVGNAEEAAAAIARLADATLRAALIAAGWKMVRARYERSVSIAAWNRALRAVLAQPALPAANTAPAPASGRLDRAFGAGAAEKLRRLLGVRYHHTEAGGEWPHSYSAGSAPGIAQMLSDMDRALNGTEVAQ